MKRSGQENGFTFRSEMGEREEVPEAQESKITVNDRAANQKVDTEQSKKSEPVPALEALEVKKRYPGVDALDGVSFTVGKGRVVGLLGPNGSGKSTFMRIAAGQTRPRSGNVLIQGLEPGLQTRKLVSYVPEHDHLYSWMKVEEAVDFFAVFFPGFSRERVGEMMEFMKIPRGKKISNLSRGMRTRLKLVLALGWNAELLLLDEPLSGIDPASREKVLQGILQGCGERGVAMLISTHLVGEVEPLLDGVVFLEEGRVQLKGDCDHIREEYGTSLDQLMRRELA